MRFVNRSDAGRQLAHELGRRDEDDPLIEALPRGGVPVAAEVASLLGADLDVILVRKLGVPTQPELAMGAIGEAGVRVLNDDVIRRAGVSTDALARIEARERAEIDQRTRRYRGSTPPHPMQGRVVVIVDDGLATGATARAACEVARANGARYIVLAVPVAPEGWDRMLGDAADEYVGVHAPASFRGVGQFYRDFRQVPDDDVVRILAARRAAGAT